MKLTKPQIEMLRRLAKPNTTVIHVIYGYMASDGKYLSATSFKSLMRKKFVQCEAFENGVRWFINDAGRAALAEAGKK